ncbi:putative outer membrane protein [Methylobacterium brachiatum]|uniref:Outer membrane protein n=1 Tax=Methylobacterium brachiatum TaxID=269660 RepID=A0AAJ1X0B4_9HYPH|nr:DUF4142 domain-containing protein [Methylobacterium brachiatum]MCB4805896.1 DUF4142 domain-containing protein [Methylobacterium brachiatum]MDQ0547170.1 putative outer membrane protein [Methylobacterium brachiatum]
MKMLPRLTIALLSVATAASASAQDFGPSILSPASPDVNTSVFRAEALRGDAYSIEASRLALARSNNPRIRAQANTVITNRQATTDALLPPGTSLTPDGLVVADAGRGSINSPLGLITAPLTIAGGVVGAVTGVVDNRPSEPGKRVALDPVRQKKLADLDASRGRAFDRTYAGQQAASDAETLKLYQAYARTGDSAQGRQFARQATPMLQDEFDGSARLQGLTAEDDDAAF